jgi:CBS domain-containing protein
MTGNPIALQGTASVRDAAVSMRDAGVGAVLVKRGDTLLGIVTDRDIAVRGVATEGDCSRMPLSQICSHDDLAIIAPDDDLERAVSLMRARAVRRLLVMRDGEAVGILSLGDLALERDPYSVLAHISHARPNH